MATLQPLDTYALGYDRSAVMAGIAHIGVGNFHRSHQAYYLDQYLTQTQDLGWGVCGISLLEADRSLAQHLQRQHGLYSLTTFGAAGTAQTRVVGSLVEVLFAPDEAAAVIRKLADPAIKIITLTITEGGYNINKETGEFNLSDEKVQADLSPEGQPRTVFGFVAQGLRQRRDAGNGGVTILSCDNLQHNGNTARKAFLSFIEAQDAELARWVTANVSFPNSMVDRITPATTSDDVARLTQQSGLADAAPVYCEDFIQWVIEDTFIAGRPALEQVGVEFTTDVTNYENMKLSLLNASHTLLSYPAFLKGYRKVDEAMGDAQLVRFVQEFMDLDITPYVPAPLNTDLSQYKQTLLARFANAAVSDQVARLCADGLSKFPVYIVPNLAKLVRDQRYLGRVSFLLAAYRHYLTAGVDERGQAYRVQEPSITVDDQPLIVSRDALDFLDMAAFKRVPLRASATFTTQYLASVAAIEQRGITAALAAVVAH